MKKLLAGVAGALSLALLAPATQAAPLGATGNASGAGATSEIIQVHGIHASCKRDRFGWHRSHLWGRERCRPAWMKHDHHHHGKKHWKKKH